MRPHERYIPRVPAKEPKREFEVGDKIRVNLHRGKIEDAVVRAVVQLSQRTRSCRWTLSASTLRR
jgi:hypothetical protein